MVVAPGHPVLARPFLFQRATEVSRHGEFLGPHRSLEGTALGLLLPISCLFFGMRWGD